MNRLTEDEKVGLLLGSAMVVVASGVYYTSVRPFERSVNSLERAASCTPRQVDAVYNHNREAHGQAWRDTASSVGEALDKIGLGFVRPVLEDSVAWLTSPPAEGTPGSIQPVAVTGLAVPTSAAPTTPAPSSATPAGVTYADPNLSGLIEAVSSASSQVAPPNTLYGLNGSRQLFRTRTIDVVVDTVPAITPMAIVAFHNASPLSILGSSVDVGARIQQRICRTVAEEPWGVGDPRGGTTLPVRLGSATTPSESVQGAYRGLRSAGEVKYRAENSWRHLPWLSFLLAGERVLRIKDKGLHAGASLTVVGGLRRDANGALELCAHPDFGFCVPTSLRQLVDSTRGAMRLQKLLLGALGGLGAMLMGAAIWEHRYFMQRFAQWVLGRRAARPRWGDVRCHRRPTDALMLLRRALQHQAAGGDVDALEVEPGVFARGELARAAGPGVTAVEELNVADDVAMGEEEDPAVRCVVCLQRRRCIMCLPCRHVATCIECMVVHTLNRRAAAGHTPRCPVCMTDLQWIQRVYL